MEYEVGGHVSRMDNIRNVRKTEGKDHSEDLGVDGKIILG